MSEVNFLLLVDAAVMWCQDIIVMNAKQGHRDAKHVTLEISLKGCPLSSITWVCTLSLE